jgi:ATP-dependent RNA helicase DDX35
MAELILYIPLLVFPFSLVLGCALASAAQTLAQRVSEEVGRDAMGGTVGYTVRFDDCSDPYRTRIKFVTDGILLREATLQDPLLSKYSVVIVDEGE